MSWLRTRAARIPEFVRVVVTLILTSVALVTALAFWTNQLGYFGIGVVAGLIAVGLLAVIAMPDSAWSRLTGADTVAEELGRLHEEGVQLRSELPWVRDTETEALNAYRARLDDWVNRVDSFLDDSAPRWKGVFLSNITGVRYATSGYGRASRYRNYLDDRLERLSQIVAALGGSR